MQTQWWARWGAVNPAVMSLRSVYAARVRVYVVSSGSSGNATIVESGGVRILVDAGLGPRACATRLKLLGEDLFPRGVDAMIVTHDHGDHSAHVEPLARALGCPLYFHEGIGGTRARAKFEVRNYCRGDSFSVGTVEVHTRKLPHDSPQIAVGFSSASGSFALVTDLGRVPSDLPEFLARFDVVLLESNYCPDLLEVGPYPVRLRQRVSGGVGHLSNDESAALVAALAGTKVHTVHLGHISRANNTTERALEVVRRRAGAIHVHAIPHGEPRAFRVGPGQAPAHSEVPKRAGTQLSLPI